MATASERKREVRELARTARDRLGAEARARGSARVRAHLAALDELRRAEAVAAYAATDAEVDLDPFLRDLIARGVAVHLPVVVPDGLAAARVRDLDRDLVHGYRGVREPREGLARVASPQVGVALVPGVAFAPDGGRVGYGGGHFDRFLGGLGEALRVGVAFSVQVLDAVPVEPHDLRVDMLVTEEGILRVAG